MMNHYDDNTNNVNQKERRITEKRNEKKDNLKGNGISGSAYCRQLIFIENISSHSFHINCIT